MVFNETYDINGKLILDLDTLQSLHQSCPIMPNDEGPIGFDEFINRVKHTCNIILGEFKLSVASIQFSLDDRSQQIRINATG